MDGAQIEWCDTINNPKLIEGDALMKFDIVVANPPFSLDKWGHENAEADRFKRFFRGIPPKSKGDYAFIQHMIETTAPGGKVGVIVPHGVLFRGSAEQKIRRQLIEENLLEAVIGLPTNLFYGTGIPAAILVFNKAKTTENIVFIDASKNYEDGKRQNKLRPQDIEEIIEAFKGFKTIEKFSSVVTPNEIVENDYNLNIPRYVDTFEEEEPVDIEAVQEQIEQLETELVEVRKEMKEHLKELGY
jgi:type I restriction enzyme M protein